MAADDEQRAYEHGALGRALLVLHGKVKWPLTVQLQPFIGEALESVGGQVQKPSIPAGENIEQPGATTGRQGAVPEVSRQASDDRVSLIRIRLGHVVV